MTSSSVPSGDGLPLFSLFAGSPVCQGLWVPAASKGLATRCLSPRGMPFAECVWHRCNQWGWQGGAGLLPRSRLLALFICLLLMPCECWQALCPVLRDSWGSSWHTREHSQEPRAPVSPSPSVLRLDGTLGRWATAPCPTFASSLIPCELGTGLGTFQSCW